MSLILDALKKLEREKDAREPGVLVVGSVPWGERRGSRRPFAFASLTLVALVSAAWLWWHRPPHPTAAAPASAPTSTPTPSPVVAASPSALPTPVMREASSSATAPPARRLAVPTLDGTEGSYAPTAVAPVATRGTREAPDDLRLNAIAQRDGRPVALVNERLVFEGDSFDGVRIIRIGEAEVEVEVRGQRRVLRF